MLLEEATSKQQVEEALALGDYELSHDINEKLREASRKWRSGNYCQKDDSQVVELDEFLHSQDFLDTVIYFSSNLYKQYNLRDVPRDVIEEALSELDFTWSNGREYAGPFLVSETGRGFFHYAIQISLSCWFPEDLVPVGGKFIPRSIAQQFWRNLNEDGYTDWDTTALICENSGSVFESDEYIYITSNEEVFEAWCGKVRSRYFTDPPETKTGFGKKTRALSKLRKQTLPMKAGAFKKIFPAEFEAVKEVTQGRDFTPELLEQLVEKFGFKWAITKTTYNGLQVQCPGGENEVLQFNVDISDPVYTDKQRNILLKVRELSYRSGHPVVSSGLELFTIGWVRYCHVNEIPTKPTYFHGEIIDETPKGPRTLLVEEIQSDVGGVRRGLKDQDFISQLEGAGLDPEEIDAAVALMQPFADRFYEDALGVIFDYAEHEGVEVEMLSYEQKKGYGSPRSLYTDLPKSLGMKLRPSTVLEGATLWHYKPNRRRVKFR